MENLRIKEEDLELVGVDSGGSPILYYQRKPFTGICLTYEDAGWLSLEEEYQNGYLEGWTRFYYENGQIEQEYQLHNNVVVAGTLKKYDENGTFIGGF